MENFLDFTFLNKRNIFFIWWNIMKRKYTISNLDFINFGNNLILKISNFIIVFSWVRLKSIGSQELCIRNKSGPTVLMLTENYLLLFKFQLKRNKVNKTMKINPVPVTIENNLLLWVFVQWKKKFSQNLWKKFFQEWQTVKIFKSLKCGLIFNLHMK